MTTGDKLAISGATLFDQVVKTMYPDLTILQIGNVRNQLLTTFAEHMNMGYQPAVVRQNSDGTMDVTVFTLGPIKRKKDRCHIIALATYRGEREPDKRITGEELLRFC